MKSNWFGKVYNSWHISEKRIFLGFDIKHI